ncbi:alpha/beta fold hydrolase [Actinoplanes sp. Pm04-4]|uniref:Alpha/beta fold hydrolase n=1 Tax=Paractinoplanes pyxinae TaxID=2997416 RepID=A0ABT4B9X2_9ACTN|nr:alpha/beta fold hydrolase [Actinoplanes pyxinae]MCY1143276.1 alpha/beta fold hydrolase [Actinoplanes pyxinae]
MIAHPGLRFADHTVSVPLDHRDPGGETIEVFAREVVAADKQVDDLPWLVFLQGGPGGSSPRPLRAEGWIARAVKSHRVLLLDQRGTGRSTPLTARAADGRSAKELADYVRLFRADSIVADAEILRARLAGGAPWDSLGQSYGGFVTMTYLSQAPSGLRRCYVTGGLPGLTASADEVYARTYPRVADKNASYYRQFPDDVAAVRHIADHLAANDVRLPDGDRLTVERFRFLGSAFGMSYGYAHLHWILDEAWHGDQLSATFLYEVMALTAFVDKPLYALQEYCYGLPGGGATGWAAERAMAQRPEFAAGADPLLFTGEMMYPWMFSQIAALRPFAEAAELLASADDWPALYDLDRLAANEVPVVAAVYADDMYVDMGLSLETAAAVGNVRTWITNEYEHDGLRTGGEAVVGRLMDMAAGLA